MEIKDIVEYAGWTGGFIVFVKSLIEYQNAQKWKKAEFLSKEAKEFFADKNVSRALLFLDYRENDIPIYENEIEGKKVLHYGTELLMNSFDSQKEISSLTTEEKLIRRVFDDFLTKLGFFNHYIDTKLINEENLKPYLGYWLMVLGSSEKSFRNPVLMSRIWEYIDELNQNEVRILVNRFGYEPDFKSKIKTRE